ncbi:general secretion pathway protein GspB [Moritella dasanensis]|uniref:general secretion pathway protein GspB n=1 Tax=Moritella dasanensis TaxID=428031 RepID=UPI00030B1AC9|nr:general secretion pathway protein GspB [Moritella dasanensis]
MNFIIGKALRSFSVGVSLVVSVFGSSTLLANTNISVGVEQTDPLTILKLADIKFEHVLSVVDIPKQEELPTHVENNTALVIPSSKPGMKVDSGTELLTMNDELASEQVSAGLLAKFNRALSETSGNDSIPAPAVVESYNAVPIADLPQYLREQIPDISYSSHVYSSKIQNRSVRINNRDLREGSWLTDDIEVLEILQNEVIMRVGAQSFSLNALSDWSA